MSKGSFLSENQISELSRLVERNIGKNKILTNILTTSKKSAQEIYNKMSFPRTEIKLSENDFEDLLLKNMIKIISKKDSKITLTLKSIMILEYKIFDINPQVNKMLDDINKEFFDNVMHLSEKPVSSKEKAIIIALIGLNTFSEGYMLQLKEEKENEFKSAVDIAVVFLKTLGQEFDDGTLDKIWSRNVIGEGPVLAEMRRLNQIQMSTEGVYKNTKSGHYLDILKNNKLNEERFNYILSRIFDKRTPTYEEKKQMIKALDEIQQYEFKLFRTSPPFNTLDIRKRIKYLIESF
jgi:hypothetical protein